jgi:hypothetical protein
MSTLQLQIIARGCSDGFAEGVGAYGNERTTLAFKGR